VRLIDRWSALPSLPYSNLVPLVDLLVQHGNVALDGGFVMDRDGWRCRLTKPIDVETVRREFQIPSSIQVSAERDTILDSLSWCSVEGPGATTHAVRSGSARS
jgi:hypothetical protein